MSFLKFKKAHADANRLRLQKLVDSVKTVDTPPGWKKKSFAIGGLTEVGFSKEHTELLLVISSQGRGVFNCQTLQKIERDYDIDFDNHNEGELWAYGIGCLAKEKITLSGLYGGGLPHSNSFGDHIQYMAPQWPIIDLIFEPLHKSIYNENTIQECFNIYSDYEVRAYGFSYDSQSFIIATSSDIHIYRKD